MASFGQWLKDLLRLSTKPRKTPKQLRDPKAEVRRETITRLQSILSTMSGENAKLDEALAIEKADKNALEALVMSKLGVTGDHVIAKADTIMRECEARREVKALEEKLAAAKLALETLSARNPLGDHREELLAAAEKLGKSDDAADFLWLQKNIHTSQKSVELSIIKTSLTEDLREDSEIQALINAIEKEFGKETPNLFWRPKPRNQ